MPAARSGCCRPKPPVGGGPWTQARPSPALSTLWSLPILAPAARLCRLPPLHPRGEGSHADWVPLHPQPRPAQSSPQHGSRVLRPAPPAPGLLAGFALVFIKTINNFKDSKRDSAFSSLPRQSFKSTVTHRDLAETGVVIAPGDCGLPGAARGLPQGEGRARGRPGGDENMTGWAQGWFEVLEIKLCYDYTSSLWPLREFGKIQKI